MSTIAEKLTTIAENMPKVYEAGKQAEYDAFWDILQDYGNREIYMGAFAYAAWTDATFKPKYDIKIVGSGSNVFNGTKIVDLEATLGRCGRKLDTSEANNLNSAFSSRNLEVIPTIDMRSITASATSNANLNIQPEMKTIRKIIIDEATPWHTSCFRYATGLTNLVVEGVIGNTNWNLQYSKNLSKDSIISAINALSNNTSGLSIVFSEDAVISAFGSTDATEWQTLVATKPNWTISLV